MPHLFLLVTYTAVALVVNAFDMLMSYRVIKETQDNFFFYVALIQDGIVILYVLVGLIFAVWAFWGMPTPDKNAFIVAFFIVVILLAISAITVVVGLEGIIWRDPGEFIDLTWLFELIILGYEILKWVVVLSYTIALAEIGRAAPNALPPTQPAYQLVPTMKFQEMQPMFEVPKEQPKEEPKAVWTMPHPMSFQMFPVYGPQ